MKIYPAFLLGMVLLLSGSNIQAQKYDEPLKSYLEKLANTDSASYYHQKVIDYSRDIPELAGHLLYSSINISQVYSGSYTDPDQRPIIQYIYDALHAGVPLDVNYKLTGYRILGDYYHVNYDIDQALAYYHHALSIADTSRLVIKEQALSVLYTNLSDVYLSLGEFSEARLLIEKTIELDLKTTGPVSEFLGIDYINLALTYKNTDPLRSIDYYLKAKNQLKSTKLLDDFEFNNLYIFLADSYLEINNKEQALLEIDSVMLLTQNRKDRSSLIYEKALEKKAVILQSSGNFLRALNYHHQADALFKKRENAIAYRPKVLLNQARCYSGMNLPKKALEQIEQAFYLIDQTGDLSQSRFDKALFPEDLFQLYYQQGSILTQLHQTTPEITFFHRAQKAYQAALDVFEKMKHTVSDQQSRQVFMKSNADFFESAIDLNFQLWKTYADSAGLQQILLLSEKSKNNFLYESLNKTNTSLTEELPDSVLAQLKSMDRKISRTEKQLFQAKTKGRKNDISAARDELIQYRRDQKIQMNKIEKYYPQFYQLKYDISVPTVAALQEKLLPEEGVISYYVGNNHLYVLLFDKWSFSVERVPVDFSLSEKLEIFNQSIIASTGKTAAAKKALQDYHETGYFLYQKLIAPFVRKLPSHLTILPDNILENLSFDALLTALPSPGTPFQQYPFLFNKYTISYQYTINAICQPIVCQKNPPYTFLAFAPTFPDHQPYSIAQLRDFGQLTHNAEEVDNIKKIIGSGKVLKNTAATEENFMKLAPDYQIIHLATHGKVDPEHTEYSYLAFQEIKDSTENELLYIKDIYGLQLNANMVVLSACETANGSLAKGEGIVNLARGFTYAGASSVVPTLWKISDVATAKLMEKFYLELKSGQPKHMAMATAKRHFMKTSSTQSAHPFYWAAFVLIGDVSPVLIPQTAPLIPYTNTLWLGTGVLIFLLLIVITKYGQKRWS